MPQLGEMRGGELVCQREGCGDRWSQHAPGGGASMVGDCHGFQWVRLDDPAPTSVSGGRRG